MKWLDSLPEALQAAAEAEVFLYRSDSELSVAELIEALRKLATKRCSDDLASRSRKPELHAGRLLERSH